MKTQLEEAKITKEAFNGLLVEKEDSCRKMEMEVVGLKSKIEKSKAHVRFENNLALLDEILNNQRPPNDKSGLRYTKKVEEYEVDLWTPSLKHDIVSSSSEGKSEVINQGSAQSKRNLRRVEQGDSSAFPRKFRKDIPSRWNQNPRYEHSFNG